MRTKQWILSVAACGLAWSALLQPVCLNIATAGETAKTKIALVAGPCKHPPGTHEAAASARLLKQCIADLSGVGPITAEVYTEWPKQKKALAGVSSIVFTGDLFPPAQMEESEKVMAELGQLMDRGCGIVCIHFATGLRAQHVASDGAHPLLGWLGGYYASGCPHHRSVAKICTATITPADGDHPTLQGWKEFTFDDEPYWNNYFGPDGPGENVTPLAYSMLPVDEPKREIVAWAVQRADGGRGVGIVLPHYFKNWKVDDLRTFVLNSICWSAGLEVPSGGVKSTLPELSVFEPDSVEPTPRPPRKPAAVK